MAPRTLSSVLQDSHQPSVKLAPAGVPAASGADRRAHQRFGSEHLWWLRGCRFKFGKNVSVIDLSVGGALIEAPFRLYPNSSHVLEIVTDDGVVSAVTEVVRCKVSRLGDELWYRGACSFETPLTIPHLVNPGASSQTRNLDTVIRNFVVTYITRGERADSLDAAMQEASWIGDALTRLHDVALNQPQCRFEMMLAKVLDDAIASLRQGLGWDDAQHRLEARLHQVFPALDIRVVDDPMAEMKGTESFHFSLDSVEHDNDQFLKVGVPADQALDSDDFRLLKTSSDVMRLLRSWDYRRLSAPGVATARTVTAAKAAPAVVVRAAIAAPATSAPVAAAPAVAHIAPAVAPRPASLSPAAASSSPVASTPAASSAAAAPNKATAATDGDKIKQGWTKLVVRYVDGLAIRGYSNNFHPSHRQFRVWPSPTATEEQCRIVNLAELKAVFFVRTFDGDPSYAEKKTFEAPPRGRKLEVTFLDGEVMVGSTTSYQPGGSGFFLLPADSKSNNLRAFIVRSATKQVRFA